MRQELGRERELPAIDPDTRRTLETYAWPGNARELENAVKHALTFATDKKITLDVLPARIAESAAIPPGAGQEAPGAADAYRYRSLRSFLRTREKEYLEQVIKAVGGNKEEAARTLKISLATLYRKLSSEDDGSADTTAEEPAALPAQPAPAP
jgi:DNA-binding NtrC family response regulator